MIFVHAGRGGGVGGGSGTGKDGGGGGGAGGWSSVYRFTEGLHQSVTELFLTRGEKNT